MEEITNLEVIDKKGRVVSADWDHYNGLRITFRGPDNSSVLVVCRRREGVGMTL